MLQPWKCPECATWIAPGVTEHRCDPDQGVAARRLPPPYSPAPPYYQPIPVAGRCLACGMYYFGYHACWTWYTPTAVPTVVTAGTPAQSSTVMLNVTDTASARAVVGELERRAIAATAGTYFKSAG